MSYRALDTASARVAGLLAQRGVEPGDRVGVMLPNVPEFAVVYYGVLRALDVASARVAALLRQRGVRHGDRVGVMLPNVPEFAVVYYGVLRAGAVVVPMNVLLKEREVAFYLGDSGAEMLFAWHGFAEQAEAGARVPGADCVFVTPGEFGRTAS